MMASSFTIFVGLVFNIYVCSISTASVLERLNLFKGNKPVSNVTVFNAFINQDVIAKASLGKVQMDGIRYGSYKCSPLSASEDYIIQFVKLPSGVVVEDFTLYGHLSTFGSYIKDILIIIITGGTGKPEARVIIFKNHSDGFNRLYFFNAMQNYRHPQKGVYIYGLYDRPNYDGSRSKAINQYANDLPFGGGRESTLFPGTELTIKAFYQAIKGVTEFDGGPNPLTPAIEVIGKGNTQSYIILFGSYKNETESPVMKALNINTPANKSVTLTCPKIVIWLLIFLMHLLDVKPV